MLNKFSVFKVEKKNEAQRTFGYVWHPKTIGKHSPSESLSAKKMRLHPFVLIPLSKCSVLI